MPDAPTHASMVLWSHMAPQISQIHRFIAMCYYHFPGVFYNKCLGTGPYVDVGRRRPCSLHELPQGDCQLLNGMLQKHPLIKSLPYFLSVLEVLQHYHLLCSCNLLEAGNF